MAAKLAVIGGGKMGSALVGGLLASGWASPGELCIVEYSATQRDVLAAAFPGILIVDQASPGFVDKTGGVVLAVKPDQSESVCTILGALGIERVLSVAAGISTQRLQAKLGPSGRVVRAMPNTAALVGAGMSAIAGGDSTTSADLDWAESLLSAVGTVVRIPERQMDAVTAISGSGPAYLFLVAEAMTDAGVQVGLTRDQAHALVVATFAGAAKLMEQSGESPVELRAQVTSPAGVTAAGLRVLEMKGVRSAFIETVMTASERSFQLGRG